MSHPTGRIGRSWEGHLDEWLANLLAGDAYSENPAHIQTWSFPTDELRDAYLQDVAQRDEQEIMHLLRRFLFDATTFGADKRNAEWVLSQLDGSSPDIKWNSEYERRVVLSTTGTVEAHTGIRWVLDLLPSSPRLAIDSIAAYQRAHIQHLPDGRLAGLDDAQTLIHAFFIGRSTEDAHEALFGISP